MSQPALEVRVSRDFSSPADDVFRAWLDVQNAGRWLFATETGTMVRVEMDPQVGGSFVIVERRDGEDVAHLGQYLEIEPPRRLGFVFGVPKYSDDVAHVTIEIEPLAAGCRLHLVHALNPQSAEWADSTREGWTGILEGLARVLG